MQHSISIVAVNLDLAKTQAIHLQGPRITVTVAGVVSGHLELSPDRTAQICAILSIVSGVDLRDVEFVPRPGEGGGDTEFELVMRMVRHGSPYQDQRAQRLRAGLATSQSAVRVRVDAMFQQQIRAWSDFRNSSHMRVLGATIVFSSAQPSRRLLSTSGDTALAQPAAAAAQEHKGGVWNQTSSFFVRSYDNVDNSDNVLALWSKPGLSSQMCVLSLLYSLSEYCEHDELTLIHAIEELLAAPLLSASHGHIVLTKAVALAPRVVTPCPQQAPVSRRSASPASVATDTIMLQVEVIVYAVDSSTFALVATQALFDIGIVQVVVLPAKNTPNTFALSLDTSTFRSDGSFSETNVHGAGTHTHTARARLSLLAILCVCLAVAVVLSLIGCIWYQWHSHQDPAEIPMIPYHDPLDYRQYHYEPPLDPRLYPHHFPR